MHVKESYRHRGKALSMLHSSKLPDQHPAQIWALLDQRCNTAIQQNRLSQKTSKPGTDALRICASQLRGIFQAATTLNFSVWRNGWVWL